jgi:hypothetical protein
MRLNPNITKYNLNYYKCIRIYDLMKKKYAKENKSLQSFLAEYEKIKVFLAEYEKIKDLLDEHKWLKTKEPPKKLQSELDELLRQYESSQIPKEGIDKCLEFSLHLIGLGYNLGPAYKRENPKFKAKIKEYEQKKKEGKIAGFFIIPANEVSSRTDNDLYAFYWK